MITHKNTKSYSTLRKEAYPDIGDQLDAIFKLAESLKETLELPTDVQLWIDQLSEVKNKYPKPIE